MGLFNFLKKDEHSSFAPPAPPAPPPPISPVSRFDEKLPKLPPLPSAPLPPSLSKPVAPVAPVKLDKLPPLPPLPSSLGLPPLPTVPPAISASPVPQTPRMETLPPIKPVMTAPPSPSPLPVRSETKLAVPQLMPTISATRLVSVTQSPPVSPVSSVSSTLPSEEALKKVLDELSVEDFDFVPAQSMMMPSSTAPVRAPPIVSLKRPGMTYIPIARFDESVLTIRATQQALVATQSINEKIGGIESQSKSAADSLAGIMEGLQKSLIAVDEKLFQVN